MVKWPNKYKHFGILMPELGFRTKHHESLLGKCVKVGGPSISIVLRQKKGWWNNDHLVGWQTFALI